MNDKTNIMQADQAAGGQSKIRLIFHIGTGKTGTTSIQEFLASRREQLRANGIWYLGFMLEYAAEKKFEWQVPATQNVELFHALQQSDAEEQLVSVLEPTIDAARKQGMHTLIWSNESFFERSDNALGALEKIQANGVEIVLVVYIRRHDAWARSAYIQWGIKHKTYLGPLQSFGQWIVGRLPQYADRLAKLMTRFPSGVIVRNLDAVQDVVEDFLHSFKFSGFELKSVRANETPGGAELFLRAVFNSQCQGYVLPEKYDKAVGGIAGINTSPEEYLDGLLPTEGDLKNVQNFCRGDRERINALFLASGQPLIDMDVLTVKPISVDTNMLMTKLAHLVLSQAMRIERLEETVEVISARLARDESAQK